MYTLTIGQWSKTLVSSIAFLAMFGTTITVLDGYARALNEAVKLTTIRYQKTFVWIVLAQAALGLGVVLFFKSNLKDMLTFAMTLAFITTPIFAWFNYKLILNQGLKLSFWMKGLTYIGLIYLFGFASLFIIWKLSL